MFLSGCAVKVLLVIRGGDLCKSRSSYLSRRVETKENIENLRNTEISKMTAPSFFRLRAAPALARKLSGRFPRNLQGASMLLPTHNTALRPDLEKWFRGISIEPVVVGKFEDAALAKIVATEGLSITAVPTVVAAEAIERYGFESLRRTDACQIQLYLISAERRIEHPAVALAGP